MTETDYKPAKGDRVRVTIEGEVVTTYDDGDIRLSHPNGMDHFISSEGLSFEKLEPPVEVFKPGDRIRAIETSAYHVPFEVTLSNEGYVQHFEDGESRFYESGHQCFDTSCYELVYRPDFN